MVHGADMARGTSADMSKATWQSRASPRGAQVARRCAHVARTRGKDHASPPGCPVGDTWQGGGR